MTNEKLQELIDHIQNDGLLKPDYHTFKNVDKDGDPLIKFNGQLDDIIMQVLCNICEDCNLSCSLEKCENGKERYFIINFF